jgi:hypothetical protein
MARILYWNIQKFGINKINQPTKKRRRDGTAIPFTPESQFRLQVIRTTLTQNTPDIFVVVETSTGAGAPGTLISAGGALGCLDLLSKLRTWFPGPNDWRLIPPVRLGKGNVAEGISVFYNNANLKFTGPWGWQGGVNPSAPVAGMPAAYGGAWANCLPAANPGGPINGAINMNRLAGQWQFRGPIVGGVAPVLGFPNDYNRTPYLTTFWDAGNGRTIKLLSFHASPKQNAAATGTNQLANIQEMTANLGANQVGVIVGDFNVDLFNTHFEPIAYDDLLETTANGGAGYTRLINPTANQWPNKGYVCTMLRSVNTARPWTTNGYPAYEYVIKDSYSSVDNILTRYGAGAGGPAANMTIVNRTAGAPYNRVMPTPGGAPPGVLNYNTAMSQNIAGLPAALLLPPAGPGGGGGYNPGDIGALSAFKGWANYRRVRSTSDHMALIVDV